MTGGEQTGDNNPKGFNECVRQEQLQAVVEDAQKWMNEAVRKAVTNALIELNIGNSMERLDKNFHANQQGYCVGNLCGRQ